MKYWVVIGLGVSGLSCVRFLKQRGLAVVVIDTRTQLPLENFFQDYPDVAVYLGEWPQDLLNQAHKIIVSPGVGFHALIQQAQQAGVEVMGDVELFARFNQTPVVAITGTNGKSTVTTLVGEMARQAGKKVAVVGNIGVPALTVFEQSPPDLVVIELSSFQLETTTSLQPLAATILNIAPDHGDRYAHLKDYIAAKQRIYHQARYAIVNKGDEQCYPQDLRAEKRFFTLQKPQSLEFGLIEDKLAFTQTPLLDISQLKIFGQHNIANALSALALGQAVGLPMEAMLSALRIFPGLPHRCQWVAQHQDIGWINDSKATNVAACQAALIGIGAQLKGKLVLLLGGEGKGADFSELEKSVARYCRAIVVMGKDAPLILKALKKVPAYFATNMQQAVALAGSCAQAHDRVLLSPACASFDQYQNYAHRGQVFIQAVHQWIQTC